MSFITNSWLPSGAIHLHSNYVELPLHYSYRSLGLQSIFGALLVASSRGRRRQGDRHAVYLSDNVILTV